MKIAIVGYGKMGREVVKLSAELKHEITAIFEINQPLGLQSDLKGAQVIIDFTIQDSVFNNLNIAAKLGIPVVEGTTGWYNHLDDIKSIDNLTLIYSPNFSIGVYKFTELIRCAARLLAHLEYDCYIHEWHHAGKVDSPSGTAKKLADVLLKELPHKDKAVFETMHGQIEKNALHVTSTRVGRVPGIHQVGFDSSYDSIQIMHTAHGREGLALGALQAAEWIISRKGIFTMDDFMQSISDK